MGFLQFVLLILASIYFSTAQKPEIRDSNTDDASDVVRVITEPLVLTCSSPLTSRSVAYEWRKQLKITIPESLLPQYTWVNMDDLCHGFNKKKKVSNQNSSECTIVYSAAEGWSNLTLTFKKFHKVDIANYSCGVGDPLEDASFELRGVGVTHKFEKGRNSTTTYEGYPTVLNCNLTRENDERYQVVWRIRDKYFSPKEILNETYDYIETIEESNLTIRSATFADGGWYQCALWDSKREAIFQPNSSKIVASFEVLLRVRNNWIDPLKPAGIIVLEILLLGLGLFVHEKYIERMRNRSGDEDMSASGGSETDEEVEPLGGQNGGIRINTIRTVPDAS